MSIVSLKTELRQQMKLTPQLLQSIELLQMNSQELLSYLGRMADSLLLTSPIFLNKQVLVQRKEIGENDSLYILSLIHI